MGLVWRPGSVSGGSYGMDNRSVKHGARVGGLVGARASRRRFLGTSAAAGIGGLVALTAPTLGFGRVAFAADEHPMGVSPDEALKTLLEGNARYVAARPMYPDQSVERRTVLAGGQNPIAVILSCSDSRV